MASSYYSVYEHIVFSTKNRQKLIHPEFAPELHTYMGGSINGQGCHSLIVGGTNNHVHLLLRKKSTLTTPDLIKEMKRSSSEWINTKYPSRFPFHWQDGYGAFSVSYWDLEKIRAYILNQDKHHQRMSWEKEFEKLLIKHGEEFNQYSLD